MKNVVVLGSTGSIGTQTLNVIRRNPDKFNLIAIAAHENTELLSLQANEFRPQFVGLTDADRIRDLSLNYKCSICGGKQVLTDFAAIESADTIVCAVTGMQAFDGVISAISHGKDVALASKEVLVAGGEYVMNFSRKKNVRILPVDSEHSAVWQCLAGKEKSSIEKIILTASGGPFYHVKSLSQLKGVTPEQAVAHPNWSMGRKISVDSATMMNKGLEIIEARYLFDITNIDYIVHPQSIIHSMVRFIDGSTIAQMSATTMELPIQLAIGYPERIATRGFEFDFNKELTFFPPREDIFILPKLARESLAAGKNAPCVLNAANEAAVKLFLDRKIAFTDIQNIVAAVLDFAELSEPNSCEDIVSSHEDTYLSVLSDYKKYLNHGE